MADDNLLTLAVGITYLQGSSVWYGFKKLLKCNNTHKNKFDIKTENLKF